jgi:hypothetical protein
MQKLNPFKNEQILSETPEGMWETEFMLGSKNEIFLCSTFKHNFTASRNVPQKISLQFKYAGLRDFYFTTNP